MVRSVEPFTPPEEQRITPPHDRIVRIRNHDGSPRNIRLTEFVRDLKSTTWRLNDPAASDSEKALMKMCFSAAEAIEQIS
jgi:hypothetical protein